ncbi:LysR family transcriptional regulator [Pseudohoeflea suaedae]|uniref:LysR family transcriptional regulator n=1 Tax=Pseudohoeflea suaedae TaxID=877384 RepID=A0A4R5PS67_9HYPH|nr:LysR family transcriptional regulator [Pseudohoeflea suaedae]TDH39431.1 LysR family transcriptional regulator [Pseudohoeflea suaedae]
MTLEQLAIFAEVAERQHLTQAADALALTPSAVSAAVRRLEEAYGVPLFDRIGRGISLTAAGRIFLEEVRPMLARARAAERLLGELGGLQRGEISVFASQTVASYWLPPVLMRFHAEYPGIRLSLTIGNTATVAEAVAEGAAEMGFVEGEIADPALRIDSLVDDELMIVVGPDHAFAGRHDISADDLVGKTAWVLREPGSGTRSEFEHALARKGVDPERLEIALELPSNEAVLSAARSGLCATAVSGHVAAPHLTTGNLVRVDIALPSRTFRLLRHRDRNLGRAAQKLAEFSLSVAASDPRADLPVCR